MRSFDALGRGWWQQSVGHRILAATLTVGAATMLVRLASFAREMVIAREFGIGGRLDAFFLAFMIPAFVVTVISGSLNAALIPTYLKVKKEQGRDAAQALFSNVTVASTALLVVAAALLALVFPLLVPLIAGDLEAENVDVARNLFILMLPLIVLSGLATTWAAVLNAGERFAFAGLVPAATPLLTITVVLATAEAWGVYGIAGGILLGAAGEVALLAAALRRHGLSIAPHWDGMTPETRAVMRQYGPMTVGSVLMASTLLVDQSMAATLGEGAVSALNYGSRIVGFALGVTAIAVGTAVLPYFSQLAAVGNWSQLQRTLNMYLALLFAATLPIVCALWFLSEWLVAGLFEGGSFTSADTEVVAQVNAFFALQIPFYVCGILVVRVIAVLQRTVVLMWGALFCTIANIGLNAVLMSLIGVEGIALSTSIVYLMSFLFVGAVVRRDLSSRR